MHTTRRGNMKKLDITFSLILILLLSFVVFNWNKLSNDVRTTFHNQPSATLNTDITYTIGWSVANEAFEFYNAMHNGVLDKANELGIRVIAHDQKNSPSEMIAGVNELLKQDIDALVISPIYPQAMNLISKQTEEKGIPLIVLDTGYNGATIDAFIVSDSYAGGVTAGYYALELIRTHSITSKNAAIIKVQDRFVYARRRGAGFKQVMEENGYRIVAEEFGNSNQAEGYEAMKKILKNYGDDLAIVFSENDRMALGAAQAIEEAGKKGEIMLIGFDAEPTALQAIEEGSIQGTIAQQPYEMGELGVELAYQLLTGGKIIYSNVDLKELYTEIYLVDETGQPRDYTWN